MVPVGGVFVPTPAGASARSRRLAAKLEETIQQFQRENPDTSGHEIRSALLMTSQRTRASMGVRLGAIAVALGVMVAVGLAASVQERQGSFHGVPLPAIVMIVAVAAVGVVLLLRRLQQ